MNIGYLYYNNASCNGGNHDDYNGINRDDNDKHPSIEIMTIWLLSWTAIITI